MLGDLTRGSMTHEGPLMKLNVLTHPLNEDLVLKFSVLNSEALNVEMLNKNGTLKGVLWFFYFIPVASILYFRTFVLSRSKETNSTDNKRFLLFILKVTCK